MHDMYVIIHYQIPTELAFVPLRGLSAFNGVVVVYFDVSVRPAPGIARVFVV